MNKKINIKNYKSEFFKTEKETLEFADKKIKDNDIKVKFVEGGYRVHYRPISEM